jgi:alpha-1,2-mannosyltransferase
MWLEPVRTNFNYGQINLFLAVLVLGAAVASRDWLAGVFVGVAAGIKLVPAVTGLYLLAQRRLAAAVWSAGVFLATVGLMLAIIPRETRRYFTALIFDPARTGPIYSAINQSWRGALSRLAGRDGSDVSTLWIAVCLLTVVLGLCAMWSASRAGDRMAALLAAQLIGLLVSPISWSHHWIWVLPVLVWAFFGPVAHDLRVRWLAGAWLLAAYSYLVPILVALQGEVPVNSRPGWQSALGLVYPVLGAATLVVLLVVSRRPSATSSPTGGGASTSPPVDSSATRESGAPG